MVINKKFPSFKLEFQTEEKEYAVKYNTKYRADSGLIEPRVLGFQSKNAMQDDSATFTILLTGDVQWDKLLDTNDIVKVYINPDTSDTKKEHRLVTIGMISQVSKTGEYANNQIVYKIVGQSFAKPFTKFGLGIIQEVQAVIAEIGWLPDGGDTGINFTGSNAKEVMEQVLNRFSKYMRYEYDGKKTILTDHFKWSLDSWTAYENLADPTPFTNFDGSLKQLMDDITAKPFNELFFRNSDDKNKAELVLRKTPFNPSQWKKLEYITISSDDVLVEDIGKSDVETNSIFTVISPKMVSEISPDVYSTPQFHQSLVDRYGYSKLEVENRYLSTDQSGGDNDSSGENSSDGTQELTYNRVKTIFDNYTQETAGINKKKIEEQLAGTYKGVTKKQGTKAVEKYIKTGNFTKDNYKEIFDKDPNQDLSEDDRPRANAFDVRVYLEETYPKAKKLKGDGGAKEKKKAIKYLVDHYRYGSQVPSRLLVDKYIKNNGDLPQEDYFEFVDALKEGNNMAEQTDTDLGEHPLRVFSKMLFNWYHLNSNFYAGDITVLGNPYMDIGQRLFYIDEQDRDTWEFYVESIEHKFNYKDGYTTSIGVTRGLKEASISEGSPHRFAMLWNKSSDFKGGLIGEEELSKLKEKGYESQQSKGDGGSDGDSGGANDGGSLSKLKQYDGNLPKYDNSVASGNRHYNRQCTWYCYNRRAQLGIPIPLWGDAADWISGAKSSGYSTGKTPKQGACVVWQRGVPGGSSQYGHVAFVEKVLDGGKKIFISEYNFKYPLTYAERTLTVDNYMQFVYDKS